MDISPGICYLPSLPYICVLQITPAMDNLALRRVEDQLTRLGDVLEAVTEYPVTATLTNG